MATSTEGIAYQSNFKTAAGSLHNIYATNGQEYGDLLDAFPDFVAKIAAIESALSSATTVAQHVPLAPPAQQPQPTYGGAPAAAAPSGTHLCEHGNPMKLIPAGIAKASGKPYKAFYACASERGQQCNSRVSV